MRILPVISSFNKNCNKTLRSKYNFKQSFTTRNLVKQLSDFSNNKNAKHLIIGLSVITGLSIIAATMLKNCLNKKSDNAVNNSNKSELDLDFSKLFEEKPERNKYLAITSYFPQLDKEYQELLIESLKNPNENNKFVLDSLEIIFAVLAKDDGLKYRKSYFDTLNENADALEDISQNLKNANSNGNSVMHYLVLLNNGLSKNDIKKWTKYKNIDCNEFMILKDCNENIINNINLLKQNNKDFKITSFNEMPNSKYRTNYAYKLNFSDNMSLQEKLKIVTDVHKAIYGEIFVKAETNNDNRFLNSDIKTELLDSVVKDNQLDAVYNFIKYIAPHSLKNIKLSSNEVKLLDRKSDLYKQIQNICMKELVRLDIESPKMKEITELINNNDIFGNILGARHARIRFITRFVLKDNPNADLTLDCDEKMQILNQELENELDKCNYYCYNCKKGTAPQFYIKNSKLGCYVKLTLNEQGTIHTIFEDAYKIIKYNNQEI